MKILRLHIVRLLLMTLVVLPAATSCYNYDEEEIISNSNQYINVTISVSASDNAVTRAPQGGEYGDGTEKGQEERENKVNKITLIFYEDHVGINTTGDATTVTCVQTYNVRKFTESDYNKFHDHKPAESTDLKENEVLYTTGDQKIEGTGLEAGKTYKLLVVANADVSIKVGDKIKTVGTTPGVRDLVLDNIYEGTGKGIDAQNFVMASETDAEVILANPTIKAEENKAIYYFNCIHMERLAARIDYCTRGATYDSGKGGYKYLVGADESKGFYIVTKVTPFNLYNEQEYLFKRVSSGWDGTPAITYLGDETTTNYVIDPKTADKNNTETTIKYLSPMTELESPSNSFSQVMADVYLTHAITDGSGNNIIIAYPRENTLIPSSLLNKYATGIAFETKYYSNPSATPITRVYYHYLRHQGEHTDATAYQAKAVTSLADDSQACGNTPAMNFGIVRNNIYRVEISGFTEKGIKLLIKVKKWDKFKHAPIYM